MKILVIKNTNASSSYLDLTREHIQMLKDVGEGDEIILEDETSTTLYDSLEQAEVVLMSGKMDIDFSNAQNLRWVHFPKAGVDCIPAQLKTMDVMITNSSGVHPIPIAEHVIGFMLLFAKHFLYYSSLQGQRKWEKDLQKRQPFELYNKTVVIVGVGRIGSRIGELTKALGMKTIGVVKDMTKEKKGIDRLILREDLDEVLKTTDFLVNALPLTTETQGYIDKSILSRLPKTAYFINIGRGKSVNEEDLIEVLEQKMIAGAALDVVGEEPLPESSKLWDLSNIVITPHISASTPQYMERVVSILCENLVQYKKGAPLPNQIDIKRGY